MKNLFTALLLLISLGSISQSLVSKQVALNPNTGGYIEYLPKNYTNSGKYPLILFIHGLGELGSGTATDIMSVYRNGLPMYLNQKGAFYDTATFITIAPQFKAWPSASDIDSILNSIIRIYPIDLSRIYLTGLSMGGGVTWSYMGYNDATTNRIAAIVPVCGAYAPDSYGMGLIAKLGTAVWATHNADDPTVPVSHTNGWVSGINSRAPVIAAKKTIWPTGGHNAWTRTYDPASIEFEGGNIYKWMAQYSRGGSLPAPAPFQAIYLTTAARAIGIYQPDQRYITKQEDGWPDNNIGNTSQILYNVERFGTFSYAIPVPSGTYKLRLHFAELFWTAAGKRIMNVDAEGVRILSSFDIMATVPKATPLVREFEVVVKDGELNIAFTAAVDRAKLTALEVLPPSSYKKIITVQYLDSATNQVLKQYVDTFLTPIKTIIK